MDEQDALEFILNKVQKGGDDAAYIEGLLITTDMLHEVFDFPKGTTYYTAGWRSVGASLSDIAAMGGRAIAVVAAYAAPKFDANEIGEFIKGAKDVCSKVGSEYVGGDLSESKYFSVVTTAVGESKKPVFRRGAVCGDVVCVTGTLGRSAVACKMFEEGDIERGNEMYRFTPRIKEGLLIAKFATSMMDSSDGIVRSLYEISNSSGCGFDIKSKEIPIDNRILDVMDDFDDALDLAMTYGEDFELVFTIPKKNYEEIKKLLRIEVNMIGEVTKEGIKMDGRVLENKGYTHHRVK